MLKRNLIVFVGLALFVGCVKDRPRVDAQGANLDNLIEVSEVKSWNHTVETSDKESLGETTQARTLQVTNQVEAIKFPTVVSLKTDAPLLKGSIEKLDFYGKAKTQYDLKYELTPNLLKIYKVIPAKEISHYEKPYARKMGSNWWIPIGGYSVRYFNVEYIRNVDEEKSNRRTRFAVPPENYTQATHIEINRKKFIPFNRLNKKDVLPADYFTSSPWYFSAAIISTKPEDQSDVGYVDGTPDASLNKRATLIKFSKTEEQLRATNLVRDERVQISEDQADIVFNIPVEWFDSRIEPDGAEESLKEQKIPNLRYYDQPWGEFDFRNIVAIKSGGNSRVQKFFEGIVLDSLKIDKDSFSFTLLYLGSGKKEKFSFLRYNNREYKAKTYYKEDRKLFGAFPVEKYRLANLNEHREEDVEKNIFVQRFNPKKDIVFRFSTMTPKFDRFSESYDDDRFSMNYRQLGRNCTKYWNRAFELAGTNINVVLDESRDAELGDFDSNILNIIPILSNGGGGGVGPSVADPLTGETIAATTNVFVTNGMIEGRMDKIRDFIRVESGRVADPFLLDPQKKRMPILNQISREVRHFCPEVVKFAQDLKEKGKDFRVSTKEENGVVIPCAEKIMKPRLQGILCHEMGHNLGLRHNFYCSADKKNMALKYKEVEVLYPKKEFPEIYRDFYPKEEFLPEMTCVMDYADFDEFNMPAMPMGYDIAALSYIYSEKLFTEFDLASNKIKLEKYDPGQSIAQQGVYQKSRKFKYCTDEDSVERARSAKSIPIDPMCALWDNGSTPKEKLEHIFRNLREHVILYTQKFDRNFTYSGRYLSNRFVSALGGMSTLYGTWRAHLAGKLGEERKYLNNIDFDYQQFENSLKSDTSFVGQEYIGIAEPFYEILAEIIYMPDYYCVAIDADKEVHLFDFADLQKQIASNLVVPIVKGCSDKTVETHFESMGLTYITEVGSPMQPVKFSLDPKDTRETVDIVGTGGLRIQAAAYMSTRLKPVTQPMVVNKINPVVLDEPKAYELFVTDFENRMLEGLKPGVTLKNKLKDYGIELSEDYRFKKYGNATALLFNMAKLLLAGADNGDLSALKVPTKRGVIENENYEQFRVKAFRTPNDLVPELPHFIYQGNYVQPASEQAEFALRMLDKINSLESEIQALQSGNFSVHKDLTPFQFQSKVRDMQQQRESLVQIFVSLSSFTK